MNYFGTDGIRGKSGKELTNYIVAKAAQALAEYLINEQEKLKVVIGRDTRVSGEGYEDIMARALSDFGIDVISLGILPTPAIAFYIKYFNAGAGVVISASHNPPEYNGVKMFDSRGYKFTEVEEAKIEALMDMNTFVRPDSKGIIETPEDVLSPYADYILREIKPDIKNLKICIDCSEGASYKLAPYIFSKLTKNLNIMAASGKGELINVDCGATAPEALAKMVKKTKSDVGFAFDGDADRLIAVSSDGTLIDGDQLMFIHAVDMLGKGRLKDSTVVGTVMSNLGFQNALRDKGINLVREAVGDKYVFNRMVGRGFNLGGEQSGHLIFLDYQTTGDGILSAVLTATLLAKTGKTLKDLVQAIKSYPQVQSFIEADSGFKAAFENDYELKERLSGIYSSIEGRGRAVVRPSGTEPKIRIMVEAESEALAQETADKIEELIRDKKQREEL